MYQPSVRNGLTWDNNGTIRSDWNFDTIKSTSAMGTFRSMAKDLMPPGMDVGEIEDDDSIYDEGQESVDTSAATRGSDPLSGIGMNMQATHSTVIIKPPRPPGGERDIPTLLASEDKSSEETSSDSPTTPETEPFGAPPAYTGSVRSVRRASYAARNAVNGAGIVVREADIGSGVDTIRPVKKVDAAGSLRLSSEYVGSARRDGGTSMPNSPSKETHKRTSSESARAGKSIVDEVVIPILTNVSPFLTSL
jgi:serine/threonine-protein kinase 24/25/MST4